MTEKEKFIAKRGKEVEKISREQIRIAAKAGKLALKQYKTQPARLRNLHKIIVLAAQIKMLQVQKATIASQPFPKFRKGGMNDRLTACVSIGNITHIKSNCE